MHFSTAAIITIALQASTSYAAAKVCTNSRYASYVSPLASYKLAQTYCTSNYPFPQSTVTSTVTATTVTAKHKRAPAAKPTNAPRVFSNLKNQPTSVQKTVCSCIETAVTTIETVQPTLSCSSGSYTDLDNGGQQYHVYCGTNANADDLTVLNNIGNYDNVYTCIQECDEYYKGNQYVCCGVRFDRWTCQCDIFGRAGNPAQCRSPDIAGPSNSGYDLALPQAAVES